MNESIKTGKKRGERAKTQLLKTRRPKAEWLAHLNEKKMTGEHPFLGDPALEPLKAKLLALGGHAVILPAIEEDLAKILKRGKLTTGKSLMRRGDASRCHANVANLWESNGGRLKICTGYALSYDGAWRQHTWGLWEGKIVETTQKRIAYFGFRLFREEAREFAWNNY